MGNNSSSSANRARNREIRARMATTGEPWSIAARRVNADQTSPTDQASPVASTTRNAVTDASALRDSLLDWAHEQARGDVMTVIQIMPFAEEHGLDLDAAFTLVHICRDAALVRDDSTFGTPSIRLTPAGLRDVRERQQRRTDPALRAIAARTGLLRWLYRQHLDDVHMPRPDQFISADEAMHEGSPFTAAEIGYAAEYLAARALIKGPGVMGHRGPVRAEITPDGVDCVIDWSGDVSAYLRRQHGPGSTSTTINGPVFHSSADGAQLAWNSQTVTQIHNEAPQAAPGFEAIAQAVADTLRQLPAIGLPAENQEDAEAAGNEVLAEVVRDEPNRGRIRRAVAAMRGYLAPVAAGAAIGAGEGAQELARHAIEQLGSSF